MGKSDAREARDLVRATERQGWRVRESGKHWVLYAPDGVGVVTVAKTPSDRRWRANTLAALRRHGFRD